MKRTFLVIIGCLAFLYSAVGATTKSPAERVLLLIPDDASASDAPVQLWLDAASELGLHVVPIHDTEFVQPMFDAPACAGVILPGAIHRQASDAFLADIRRYVAGGGTIMLVYDFGVLSPEGKYAPGHSRISDLAGIDYALYDSLKDKTTAWGSVEGENGAFRDLEIPPGKYYPFDAQTAGLPPQSGENFEAHLRRYKYGDVNYPSFATTGEYAGHALLRSASAVVAGEHKYEKGSVLFVNLPLGYLKSNTDGLLMHAFMKYFAEHMLELPYLMPVPDGTGGLVLNWHVDSNSAIRPLQELLSWEPLQQQGPYSIHITAGPDARAFGDHLGFDIDHNPLSAELIAHYAKMGNEIGSHGGWIHDYFATHVETGDRAEIEPLLVLNKSALERVSGRPVVEYSAPAGTQPPWVTQWLEAHGFLAYYFTGNTGMGPTQGYRDGVRESQNMWEFPILHLDRAAAFEEMKPEGYSDDEVERWLEAVAEFTANQHVIRLVYFHPPGILAYKPVVMKWLELTARLKGEERFRWYTMAELANFLNSRKQVDWKISEEHGTALLDATHPQSLEHQSWYLPAARFGKPVVIAGSADIKNDGGGWIVVSRKGKHLRVESEVLMK